jgi:hypothetical protein
MKKIIVKKPDNGIIILYPHVEKYGELPDQKTYSSCKGLKKYPNMEWFVTDEDIDKSDLESRKQLYWEIKNGENIIKKDLSWEKRLMPDHIIKKKYLKKIENNLDVELKKDIPSEIEVAKLNRQYQKVFQEKAGTHNENSFWIDIALAGLDDRVKNGEPDKVEIRKKLQELKG